MGKLTAYILLMSGLTLMFYFGGLITNNPLLDLLLNPTSMLTSTFWTTIIVGSLASGAAIVVGIYTKDFRLASAFVVMPFLASLLWGFMSVFSKIFSFMPVVAILMGSPLLLLFLITMYEFWWGNET